MAMTAEAMIKPELLVWARKTSRLDVVQAAKKLQVAEARLLEWEGGTSRPTIAQLRKAADVYKRPLAVFFLTEPPRDFDVMRVSDFRTIESGAGRDISPNLAAELRWASRRREIFLLLAEESQDKSPELQFHSTVDDDPGILAQQLRALLGISKEDQFGWGTTHVALNAWRSAVESLGILVFQVERVQLEEMRGISISESILPVILINGGDSVSAKQFTLLHETTHLLIRDGGICDMSDGTWSTSRAGKVEQYCNHVAGAVLVPTEFLLQEPSLTSRRWPANWTDEEIHTLAAKFRVSDEVLLRRLVLIGAASQSFYRQKREEYLEAYTRRRQQKENQGPVVVPRHRIILRNHGLPYTQRVLEAYHDRSITASDLSDFLDMNLKHLRAIEQEAFR